jgi:hypothetical protein
MCLRKERIQRLSEIRFAIVSWKTDLNRISVFGHGLILLSQKAAV